MYHGIERRNISGLKSEIKKRKGIGTYKRRAQINAIGRIDLGEKMLSVCAKLRIKQGYTYCQWRGLDFA